MDELLSMVSAFADALRSVATVPGEVATTMKQWGAALAPAAAAMNAVLTPAMKTLASAITPATVALGTMAVATGVVVKSGLSLLPPVLQRAQREFTDLVSGLTRLSAVAGGQAVSAFQGIAGAVGAAFGPVAGIVTSALSDVPGLAKSIGSALGQLGNSATLVANALGGLASGVLSSVFESMTQATQLATSAMGSFVKGLTSSIMGPFQALAGAVAPFVQALNPGLMRVFNQALRDLTATFGIAFAPVIQHLSALFNSLSATIAPAMHALAPIIDNLMSVLEGTLVPVIGMIADAFVALSPVIEFLSNVMASVSEAMRVFYTVVRSAFDVLWKVISQFFGGIDLKEAAQSFQDVIRTLTKNLVIFAAYVARLLGQLDPFLKALQKNLADLKGQQPGQKAAPENVHVTGLEQLSKDLAVAAYSAQAPGGAQKKSEAEFLEELLKEINSWKADQGRTLEQVINMKLEQMKDKLLSGGLDKLKEFWNWIKQQTPTVDDANRQAAGVGAAIAAAILAHLPNPLARGM